MLSCCNGKSTILSQSSCSFFDNRKSFWKNVVQYFFFNLIRILFQRFYLPKKFFFFVYVRRFCNLLMNFYYLIGNVFCSCINFIFEFLSFCSQFIIRKLGNCWLYFLNFVYNFFDFFEVFSVFVA